jgi:hypothetical protein
MVSIRKLVSEDKCYKLNYFLVSKFLKDMGWWEYWKQYIGTPEFSHFADTYDDNCWLGQNNPYQVFSQCSFSSFLNSKGIKVCMVSPVFLFFLRLACPRYYYRWIYNSKYQVAEDYIIEKLKPGIRWYWDNINLDYKIDKILNYED